ncbi:MAG TPA: S-adenosylmethionine decarboxylase [Ramlibacter sp.]
MKGLHLTADLYRCRCEPAWLGDAQKLGAWCAAAAQAVGLQGIGQSFLPVDGGGISGALLLPGAHVCLHTWPGEKSVAVDVYVGDTGTDQSAKARGLMFALVNRFQPEWTEQRSLDRGEEE